MMTATIRRSFKGIVVFVAIWPLAQFFLMRAIDGTPWKLFGLAMYTTVHETEVTLYDTTSGERREIPRDSLSEDAREVVIRVNRKRRVFGTLVDPSEAASRVLSEKPEVKQLAIDFSWRHLENDTALLKTTHTTFRFDRDTPGGP